MRVKLTANWSNGFVIGITTAHGIGWYDEYIYDPSSRLVTFFTGPFCIHLWMCRRSNDSFSPKDDVSPGVGNEVPK